ncbi:hypothetical protein KQH54_03565 [bacterium]|nr:hypothetical protein [bacterium]
MKKYIFLLAIVLLLIPSPVMAFSQRTDQESVRIPNGPKFWIKDVVRGESVTIGISGMPDGKTFQVHLVKPGTDFRSVQKVGTISYLRGENFTVTFKIPKELHSETHISIFVWDPIENNLGYDIFANETGYNSNMLMSFTPVHRSSSQSAGKSVEIFNGPTLWIEDKGFPNSFNIVFDDFTGEGSYTVFIGSNNSSFQNIIVGYAGEQPVEKFTKTYDIPDELKSFDELKVVVVNAFNGNSGSMAFRYQEGYPSVVPYGAYTTSYLSSATSYTKATPYTSILNVVPDQEVTLQVFNLPADKEFIVTMGPLGSRGVNGYVIGTQSSGEGGSFIVTYPIPPQLYGSDMIAIRLESTTSGHFAYDYFKNAEGYGSTQSSTTTNADWQLSAGTYPQTQIVSVTPGESVTVSGTNFTQNDAYTVRMGVWGTQGVGGVVVDTYATDATGTFTATFTIPDSLATVAKIAIRFEAVNSPYYAYDWFSNE